MTELEDVIHIPSESAPTLSMLDSGLKRFMSLCASYHGEAGTAIPPMYFTNVNEYTEQYLQSPFQLEHACELILDSELFAFHSERMCEILVDEAQSVSNPFRFPPSQMISLSPLVLYRQQTPITNSSYTTSSYTTAVVLQNFFDRLNVGPSSFLI